MARDHAELEEALPAAGGRPGGLPVEAWVKAGLVLAVIAAVHVAAWLLLTTGARNSVASLEGRFGREALLEATDPGRQPQAGPRMAAWMRAEERWEARQTWEQRGHLTLVLGLGLLVSFALQAGFLILIALRAASRAPRLSRPRPRQ